MSVGVEPGRIIERAGFQAHPGLGLMIDTRAALRARRAGLEAPAVASDLKRSERARA